jgi:hypothetical protein
MTSVYSGGLVYEYTMAENSFGIVEINGNTVKELPEFAALATAFKNNPAPSTNGGYKEGLPPSSCPAPSATWNVQNNSLPIMPEGAKKFLNNGAGTGPGIKDGDKGSQWAGTASTGWDVAGNSSSSDTKKKNGAITQYEPSILVPLFVIAILTGVLGV